MMMHRSSICKRLFFSNWVPLRDLRDTHLTRLPFLHSSSSSFSSSTRRTTTRTTTKTKEAEQSFVVSYLINSCGLSPERAVTVSRIYADKLKFTSAKKPDSVLAFFRKHGFTDEHITKVLNACPVILSCSEKTLSPKFEFLYSIGFTKEDFPCFFCRSDIWRKSLNHYIIPLYELFKDVLGSDELVVLALKRAKFSLRTYCRRNLKQNLTLLKDVGVSPSNVALLMRNFSCDLLIRPDEFRKIADEAKSLGFIVSKSLFVIAIHALSSAYRTTRCRCSDIYKEWGFSQSDILSAFKKWPQCLLFSEKKLRETLEFLIKRMGCQVKAIAESPYVLTLDLEKRIIPRCSVIHVLVQKGLINKDWSLSSVLVPSEDYFLSRFVTKHQDISSQLLMVYQRKVDPFKDSYILTGEMDPSRPVLTEGHKNLVRYRSRKRLMFGRESR